MDRSVLILLRIFALCEKANKLEYCGNTKRALEDTKMPGLENWDGGLKNIYMYIVFQAMKDNVVLK